jgi:predicted acyl esterase
MVANMSGADCHESSVRQGGALELSLLAWAFWHSAYNSQAALKAAPFVAPGLTLGAPPFSDWLERMPIRRGQTQLALVPPYEKWALEILTRTDYDDYWMRPSVNPHLHSDRFPDMPILLLAGWYDSYTQGTFQSFVGLGAGRCAPWSARGPTGPRPWSSPYAGAIGELRSQVRQGQGLGPSTQGSTVRALGNHARQARPLLLRSTYAQARGRTVRDFRHRPYI